jgi:DNA processing protein
MIREFLALSWIPRLGLLGARELLKQVPNPSDLFGISKEELEQRAGLHPSVAIEIVRFKEWGEVDREIERAQKLGIELIHFSDSRYPALLKEIADPPLVLYVRGDASLLNSNSVAVVGSRVPSPYGMEMARELASGLSQRGVVVVSGFAMGIDAEAHEGALEGGAGTVAVFGCGLDIVYPPSNRRLCKRVIESGKGIILSEFPIGTPPVPGQFPRRNRIISGLSRGVVVVEAAARSGSLITARLALEQGREVFAVPGLARSVRSTGTHRLIQGGAKLVTQVQDILEEFPNFASGLPSVAFPRLPSTLEDLPEGGEAVVEALRSGSLSMDELMSKIQLTAGRLSPLLLNLELSGWVEPLPGQRYTLTGVHG